jgi:crossover junction endodeoxyribonuclease RusA
MSVAGQEPVRLLTPYPPSTNALWRNVGGKTLMSKQYRDWLKLAMQEWSIQKRRLIKGRVNVFIHVKAPDKRRRDLDNVGGKAIMDLLVKAGVIEDDDRTHVRSIHSEWVEEGPACLVIVRPALA